jgi:RimJ/RimL family protein N-acetyltransferase
MALLLPGTRQQAFVYLVDLPILNGRCSGAIHAAWQSDQPWAVRPRGLRRGFLLVQRRRRRASRFRLSPGRYDGAPAMVERARQGYDEGRLRAAQDQFSGDRRLRANHRGQGYGKEALRLALDFCWNHLNLNRVQLVVFRHNSRAIGAYAAAGFRKEGRLRKAAFIDGEWVDLVLMAACRPAKKASRRPGRSTAKIAAAAAAPHAIPGTVAA